MGNRDVTMSAMWRFMDTTKQLIVSGVETIIRPKTYLLSDGVSAECYSDILYTWEFLRSFDEGPTAKPSYLLSFRQRTVGVAERYRLRSVFWLLWHFGSTTRCNGSDTRRNWHIVDWTRAFFFHWRSHDTSTVTRTRRESENRDAEDTSIENVVRVEVRKWM